MSDDRSQEGSKTDIRDVNRSVIIVGSDVHGNVTNMASDNAHPLAEFDMLQLAEQLRTLRDAMKNTAQETEHFQALSEVAQAEAAAAAAKQDKNGVLTHLKAAGTWTLETARKIAVPLVVKAIEISSGMA